MSETTRDVAAVFARPALTTPSGGRYEATRTPSLKMALPFIEAVEAKASVGEQLRAARGLLLGMGFPEEAVDDLGPDEVVERATGFFLAAFQRPGPSNP